MGKKWAFIVQKEIKMGLFNFICAVYKKRIIDYEIKGKCFKDSLDNLSLGIQKK